MSREMFSTESRLNSAHTSLKKQKTKLCFKKGMENIGLKRCQRSSYFDLSSTNQLELRSFANSAHLRQPDIAAIKGALTCLHVFPASEVMNTLPLVVVSSEPMEPASEVEGYITGEDKQVRGFRKKRCRRRKLNGFWVKCVQTFTGN